MKGKQLGLGQYRLHDLVDIEPVIGVDEVKTHLTPSPPMSAGTEQQKISDVKNSLTYDGRYVGETGGSNYDQFEQSTLDVDVPIETEQSEISDYNNSMRIASD